jgi:PAS domain S-box-containing protein
MSHSRDPIEEQTLRQRAEKSFQNSTAKIPDQSLLPSDEATRKVLHELQVHKIELEMQNEELRQTQQRLDASLARYLDLYDRAPVGYCSVSQQGLIQESNRTLSSMLGVTHGDLHQQPLSCFILKEDQDRYYLLRRQILNSNETHADEFRMISRDGLTIWVEVTGSNCSTDGNESSLRLVLSNISDRKLADDELKRNRNLLQCILTGTSDAIYVKDRKGNYLIFNAAACDYVGKPAEEVLGRDDTQLFPAEQAAQVKNLDRQIMESGRTQTHEEFLSTRNGAKTFLSTKGPIRDSQGEIIGLFGIARDITERKTTELNLIEARLVADSASQAKSAFLANMSHEIRTPLTAMLGFIDILADDSVACSPEVRTQNVQTIKSAGQHLLTILNDILDLCKVESNKLTLEQVDTALVETLREIQYLMQPNALGKGVDLSIVFLTPVPNRIQSDPKRLRQILLNLVGNATKFTESGSIRVTVESVSADEGHNTLIFEITDTGPGIDSEQIKNLFTLFGQVDVSLTRKHGGSGLGLSLSKRLASEIGGDVVLVRSQPGKGSCFRFTLPYQKISGSSYCKSLDDFRDSVVPKTCAVLPTLSGRILLAEDGIDNQRLIAFMLRKAKATVEIADNGLVALRMIEQAESSGTPFDLLVTDIQMPVMDGYELVRTLRERGLPIPIIALTAHALNDVRAQCMELGCNDYTTKPIDKDVFISKCSHWMTKKRC